MPLAPPWKRVCKFVDGKYGEAKGGGCGGSRSFSSGGGSGERKGPPK